MIGVKKNEDIFYTLFCESIEMVAKAGDAFADLVDNYSAVQSKVEDMKRLETECDMQTHKILKTLNKSFITPFDREDVYDIAKETDNIVDMLEETANRFVVFDVHSMRKEAVLMTELIVSCIRELRELFGNLSTLRKSPVVMEKIIEVNRLENEGDRIHREALFRLFREEQDPIEVIKWKQLFDLLEEAIDACEGVANIIEGVVMKHA